MINPQMILQLLPMLQNNPSSVAAQYGFNIPQEQQNGGPQGIIQHLMNSGQIDQKTYNMARSMAQQMGYNL